MQDHRFETLESRIHLSAGSGAADLTHVTAQLALPRISLSGASAGGTSFFAGGYFFPPGTGIQAGITFSDTLDAFASANQQPVTTKLSQARYGTAAAGVAGKVIFAGGSAMTGPSKVVDIIDVASGKTSTHLLSRSRTSGIAVGTGNTIVIAGGTAKPDRTVDIWNISSNRWSTSKMPHALSKAYDIGAAPDLGAAVAGSKLIFTDGKIAELYDTLTGRWTTAVMPNPTTRPVGTSIGGLAIFVGQDGLVNIYNDVTGAWTTQTAPQKLYGLAATSVGTKAIFAGGSNIVIQGSSAVSVFDSFSGQWSQTSLSVGRDYLAGTSSSGRAIFAGGMEHIGGNSVNAVDIFTDNTPIPVLSGGLSGNMGHRARVTVFNTGDADLTNTYSVNLYASTDRTLTGAVLVGSRGVISTLATGSSATFNIRTIKPKDLPAGKYHLLAAIADSAGNLTPITAEDSTFRVTGSSQVAVPAISRTPMRFNWAFTRASHVVEQWI